MKILIIRTIAIEEDLQEKTYNNQGIGLATELSKLGNECGLVYYAKKGKQREETITSEGVNLKIYHIEGKNIVWNAIYNSYLYNICEMYDLIQTSECDQICSWEVYKRFPEKTVIYHGPYSSKFTWKYNIRSAVFDKVFASRNDFKKATVITKSHLAENYLRKKGFHNLTTLGVGLNSALLEEKIEKLPEKLNNIIAEKKDSKYFLYVGAISKRKNLMFLLEMFDELVNGRKYNNYKLLIVGGKAYKEDDYYNKCFEFIRARGLKNNVNYLGTLEQKYLKYLYKNSDVYLLATQYDIFGMVYLEALYFGTPIITTLCGGSSLLIKEGETGYIKALGDTRAWCDVAENILENPEELKKMRQNGIKLIREQYMWSNLAPRFLEVYNGLLSKK